MHIVSGTTCVFVESIAVDKGLLVTVDEIPDRKKHEQSTRFLFKSSSRKHICRKRIKSLQQTTVMAVVILDSDHIPEGISKKFVRYPGEPQSDFYNRVTHLHHQSQKICQIGDLSAVRNLTVLYLYNNRIEKIEHLDAVPNLQMLYLQKNRIKEIENLDHLTRLKKLYLSNNKISVVENLESLVSLKGTVRIYVAIFIEVVLF